MFDLKYSSKFKKDFKKLTIKEKELTKLVLEKLTKGEKLESKYKDHSLKGRLEGLRDCHIKPDLVLIYKKQDDKLILTALRISSHSEIFG